MAAPATALATPILNPSSPTTISESFGSAPVVVGNQLECNAGSWSSTGAGPVYTEGSTWYRDSTSGTELSTEPYYTPVAEDAGHKLVCEVTEYDESDYSTATATSAPTAAVLPEPSVAITQYSPAVSGNIGESDNGVAVTVTLERSGAQVATATTSTNAAGGWSVDAALSSDRLQRATLAIDD
jgi:hypothetical protein